MKIYVVIEKDPTTKIICATTNQDKALEAQEKNMSYVEIQVWEDDKCIEKIPSIRTKKKKQYSNTVDYHMDKYGKID